MMRELQIAAVVALTLLLASAGHTEICTETDGPLVYQDGNGTWRTKRTIPVYLFASRTDTTWNGMPIGEVEANIKAALDAYLQEGGADVRMYWAGRTTSPDDRGRIIVRIPPDCKCGLGQACAGTTKEGSRRVGSTVWFETFQQCFTIRPWQSDPTEDSIMGFRNLLIHELGHSLGLKHPEQCQLGFRYSVMSYHAYNELQLDDQESLVSLYGLQCRQVQHYLSTYMTVWLPGDKSASCIRYPARGGGPAFQDTAILGTLGSFTVRSALSTDETESFLDHEFPDLSATGLTTQATAAARGATPDDQILVWTHGEDNATGPEAFTRIATTRDGGASWTVRSGGPAATSENAPTVTYDPKSGFYLVFWDHYATYTLDGQPVFHGNGPGQTPASIHAPVAACRDTTDANNCLVAWERINAYGCLDFMHTQITSGGQLQMGVRRSDCYVQERSPSIVHREVDPTTPWGLALKQQETIFSFVKTEAEGTWKIERMVVHDPVHGVLSPSITLVGDDSRWEYRVYTGRRH